MSMLGVALDPATVVVAVDPGKVTNRVWISNGAGRLADPPSPNKTRYLRRGALAERISFPTIPGRTAVADQQPGPARGTAEPGVRCGRAAVAAVAE